jgi:hypothetical protein
MSAVTPMSGLRRRAMPGMPSHPEPPTTTDEARDALVPSPPVPAVPGISAAGGPRRGPGVGDGEGRWRAEDYSATRLANFRLPVDLHDRYRRLVADVERDHPRLRHPSLTEVIIALQTGLRSCSAANASTSMPRRQHDEPTRSRSRRSRSGGRGSVSPSGRPALQHGLQHQLQHGWCDGKLPAHRQTGPEGGFALHDYPPPT